MFRSDSVVEDEYIREYAFEPELLINRHDYLKQEQQRVQSSTAAAAARLDGAYHQHRRYSFDIYDEYKNQVDVEIEAFYHASGWYKRVIIRNMNTRKLSLAL
uniref:Uncharacterized protein n=1 Tax=Glossina pallidipes TaxID=7398 RepID=A0A1A9ZUJ3_GLOPL